MTTRTAKKADRSHKASSTKNPAPGKRKPSSAQTCWPGFEPTPGKAAGEKGSCRKKAGKQPKSVRVADQKRAAASKLRKTSAR